MGHFGENGVIRVFWGYSVKNHRIASPNIPNRISRLTELPRVTLSKSNMHIFCIRALAFELSHKIPAYNNARSPGYKKCVEWLNEIWTGFDFAVIQRSFVVCGISNHRLGVIT